MTMTNVLNIGNQPIWPIIAKVDDNNKITFDNLQ